MGKLRSREAINLATKCKSQELNSIYFQVSAYNQNTLLPPN